MNQFYKGYRVGTLEKELLKFLTNTKNVELPQKGERGAHTFSEIFNTIRQKNELPNMVKRLKRKGLVSLENKKGYVILKITQEGKDLISQSFPGDYQYKNTKPWDKMWRMVIFDIPESKKLSRNLLRWHLKKIGFIQVQQSVWLFPYPVSDLVTLIKANFKFNKEVLYLVVKSIEHDHLYKKHFKLN